MPDGRFRSLLYRRNLRHGTGDHWAALRILSRRQADAGRLRRRTKDVKLDAPERITANEQRIYEQVVATKAMPIGNLTGMTDAERATIAAWVAGGARSR